MHCHHPVEQLPHLHCLVLLPRPLQQVDSPQQGSQAPGAQHHWQQGTTRAQARAEHQQVTHASCGQDDVEQLEANIAQGVGGSSLLQERN